MSSAAKGLVARNVFVALAALAGSTAFAQAPGAQALPTAKPGLPPPAAAPVAPAPAAGAPVAPTAPNAAPATASADGATLREARELQAKIYIAEQKAKLKAAEAAAAGPAANAAPAPAAAAPGMPGAMPPAGVMQGRPGVPAGMPISNVMPSMFPMNMGPEYQVVAIWSAPGGALKADLQRDDRFLTVRKGDRLDQGWTVAAVSAEGVSVERVAPPAFQPQGAKAPRPAAASTAHAPSKKGRKQIAGPVDTPAPAAPEMPRMEMRTLTWANKSNEGGATAVPPLPDATGAAVLNMPSRFPRMTDNTRAPLPSTVPPGMAPTFQMN